MSANLAACPFCGAKVTGPHKTGDSSDERTGYNFSMRITCDCGASISRPSRYDKQGWCNDTGQAADAVVQAWNRRAGSSQE